MHAAITIISKNYASFAKVLAESYKRHHTDHHFIIILVDRADDAFARSIEGIEFLELEALEIPQFSSFVYRYSILELNTAAKAFAFDYLFRTRSYETIIYLDPDIWVFRPLDQVYRELQNAAIVLTPHMRRPYFDSFKPTELNILQSGAYNLGFLVCGAAM